MVAGGDLTIQQLIASAFSTKLLYNESRPYRHGGKRA